MSLLERRRLIADITPAFKAKVDLYASDFFLRPPRAGLRGHTYRLLQRPSRFRCLFGSVAKYWNRLSAYLVTPPYVIAVPLRRHFFETPDYSCSLYPQIYILFICSLLALVVNSTMYNNVKCYCQICQKCTLFNWANGWDKPCSYYMPIMQRFSGRYYPSKHYHNSLYCALFASIDHG